MPQEQPKSAMAKKLSIPSGNKNSSAGNGSATKRFLQRSAIQLHDAKLSHNIAPYAFPRSSYQGAAFQDCAEKACGVLNVRKLQPTAVNIWTLARHYLLMGQQS